VKKLLISWLFFLVILTCQSAVIIYKWNVIDNPVTVGGLPPKYLKLSYGPTLRTYTNWVVVGLTNINTTNVYRGWDQYNCTWVDVKNYVEVKVTGLVLSQQIYSAYSLINSNGVESPYINESTCGFTVTNNSDMTIPPVNLRIASMIP
jgi:hypothetical protein